MYGIVLSALRVILTWVMRTVVVKWLMFWGLYFVIQAMAPVVAKLIPNSGPFSSALGNLPCSMWFFLDWFGFSGGLPLLMSAWVTRFIIRRLPVVG